MQAQTSRSRATTLHLALTLRDEHPPGDDRQTVELLDRYAAFLRKLGRTDEAQPLETRAKAIRARSDCASIDDPGDRPPAEKP